MLSNLQVNKEKVSRAGSEPPLSLHAGAPPFDLTSLLIFDLCLVGASHQVLSCDDVNTNFI